MKFLLILLFIVNTTQAQYRTYKASAESIVGGVSSFTNLQTIKIEWKDNKATNIDNMLSLNIGGVNFKVIDYFKFESKTNNTWMQKVHVVDDNNKIYNLHFTRSTNLNDTKFILAFIEPFISLLIYADFNNCTFN